MDAKLPVIVTYFVKIICTCRNIICTTAHVSSSCSLKVMYIIQRSKVCVHVYQRHLMCVRLILLPLPEACAIQNFPCLIKSLLAHRLAAYLKRFSSIQSDIVLIRFTCDTCVCMIVYYNVNKYSYTTLYEIKIYLQLIRCYSFSSFSTTDMCHVYFHLDKHAWLHTRILQVMIKKML